MSDNAGAPPTKEEVAAFLNQVEMVAVDGPNFALMGKAAALKFAQTAKRQDLVEYVNRFNGPFVVTADHFFAEDDT